MNKLVSGILSIVIALAFVTSSALAEKPAGKMTKEQAQSLVAKKYPGARIINAQEKTSNGNTVWIVRFMQTGGNTAQQVQVDESGKLTRM